MGENRRGKWILAGIAVTVLLCLSGCDATDFSVSSSTDSFQQEELEPSVKQEKTETAMETTIATEPDMTESEKTEPDTNESVQTEPDVTESEQTEPDTSESVQTEPDPTESEQTQPPQTEPIQTVPIQSQDVIAQAIAALAERMPELKYDSGWSGGTVVELPIDATIPQEDVSNKLVAYLLELFEYDRYLEEPFVYTYNLGYRGIADGESQHYFEVSYTAVEEVYEEYLLDGAAVAAQVTQGILDSSLVNVDVFDGSDYTERIVISDIPYFYNTQKAVEDLIDTVEKTIYTKNAYEPVYTAFQFVFDYFDETYYVFSLYLK